MLVIVMGVSGSGKSTIGLLLAERLHIPFTDADNYHSNANVSKMQGGEALSDEDRTLWLLQLNQILKEAAQSKGIVMACSALKEQYRKTIQKDIKDQIYWVFLHGANELLENRISKREGHFMPASLLQSQLKILEKPAYGIHVNVENTPEKIIETIIQNMNTKAEIGIIGLGVMGSSLALNFAEHGISTSGYNRNIPGVEEDVAKIFLEVNNSFANLQAFDDLEKFINSLETPRKILLMIKAGAAVDAVIADLLPLLTKGDIIMDGGNSSYKDTSRRTTSLKSHGINFLGVGVSGGEEGARKGPSIMPGGDKAAYKQVEEFFNKIAAKDKNDNACCAYIGNGGAGHFVKMVHNGIEYAEMQLITEAYSLLRNLLSVDEKSISEIFEEWNSGEAGSFLLEITIKILQKKENGEYLLNKIVDAAEQKGTGWWAAAAAMELGIPFSIITEAVMARNISAQKQKRTEYSQLYNLNTNNSEYSKKDFTQKLLKAYQTARILNHAIGFELILNAGKIFNSEINLSETARIWTNGCIIRSKLMENLVVYFSSEENLLHHPDIVKQIKDNYNSLTEIITDGNKNGIALPVFAAALNYFLGITTANSTANLIQAQRDYFGAHTYRITDKGEDEYFHTEW
ncbi:MAG: NADP-dependent phosphogluconate dehydrogenase [Bacteroidia bacterium]